MVLTATLCDYPHIKSKNKINLTHRLEWLVSPILMKSKRLIWKFYRTVGLCANGYPFAHKPTDKWYMGSFSHLTVIITAMGYHLRNYTMSTSQRNLQLFNVLLFTTSELKVIGNWFCAPTIFANLFKTSFYNLGQVCWDCNGISLIQKTSFYWIIKGY